MKRPTIAVLLCLGAGLGGLAACSESILRDDYMGKSWLQPDKVYQPVKHDDQGNPILE